MKRVLLISTIISLVFFQNIYGQSGNEFSPVNPTGIPYSIVISEISLNNGLLPDSTEIGVFDDTLCVGKVSYSGNINQQLVAWEGDPSQGLFGFTPGQLMVFKVRLLVNSDYYIIEATPSYTQGTGEFGYGNFSVVSLSVTTTLVEQHEIIEDNTLTGYPNPFQDKIEFNLNNSIFNDVRILDNTGKTVYSKDIDDHSRHYSWSGINNKGIKVPDGMYFIHFSSESNSKIIKVIFQNN